MKMLSYRRSLRLLLLRRHRLRLVVDPNLFLQVDLPPSLFLRAENYKTKYHAEFKGLVTRMLQHLRRLMLLVVTQQIQKIGRQENGEGLQIPEPENDKPIGPNSM